MRNRSLTLLDIAGFRRGQPYAMTQVSKYDLPTLDLLLYFSLLLALMLGVFSVVLIKDNHCYRIVFCWRALLLNATNT